MWVQSTCLLNHPWLLITILVMFEVTCPVQRRIPTASCYNAHCRAQNQSNNHGSRKTISRHVVQSTSHFHHMRNTHTCIYIYIPTHTQTQMNTASLCVYIYIHTYTYRYSYIYSSFDTLSKSPAVSPSLRPSISSWEISGYDSSVYGL